MNRPEVYEADGEEKTYAHDLAVRVHPMDESVVMSWCM